MRRLLRIIGTLSAFYLIALVVDLPLARGHFTWLPEEWYFQWLRLRPRLFWVGLCALAVGLYTIGALHLARRGTWRGLKLWAFVGAALLPLLAVAIEGPVLFTLFARVTSPDLGGYSLAAALSDNLNTLLREWPTFTASYRERHPVGGVALAPPGLPVVFFSVARAFEAFPALAAAFADVLRGLQCQNPDLLSWSDGQWASALPALYLPLWSALAVAPVAGLGRRIFGEATARMAVALYPLVPGLAIFAGRFNTFYALLCAVMLVFLWEGLARRGHGWKVAFGGFVVGVGTFLNFATVPLGLLGGFTVLLTWWRGGRRLSALLGDLARFGLGAAAVWVAYGALTGISPLDILRASFDRHYQLVRPYALYLFVHPYEMFYFTGLPVALLALWRVGKVRGVRRDADVFALVGALSLLVITLSGTARGETARVWLFFAPVWVLIAADLLRRAPDKVRQIVFGLQAALLVVMVSTFQANFHIYTPVPQPAPPAAPPTVLMETTFRLGADALTLVGWRAVPEADGLTLHLYWRAEGRGVRGLYQFSLVPRAPDGTLRAGQDWIPYARNFPPSCLTPGALFADAVRLPLRADDPRGDWWFSLAVVDVRTGTAMRLADGAAQIGVGAVVWP
jgi:hypothetical protein